MSKKIEELPPFDEAIKYCNSNQEILNLCHEHIIHAIKIISKENIKFLEDDVEENGYMPKIVDNLESSLRMMIEIGVSGAEVVDSVSNILENIQPGKIQNYYIYLVGFCTKKVHVLQI